MLNHLNEILVEYHALTDVLNADVLVGIVNGGKLFFVQVNGGKTQNVVGYVGKATGIGACRQKERHHGNVGEIKQRSAILKLS